MTYKFLVSVHIVESNHIGISFYLHTIIFQVYHSCTRCAFYVFLIRKDGSNSFISQYNLEFLSNFCYLVFYLTIFDFFVSLILYCQNT
nr:MAG TPA: hypothetical protein [Crassvirales sp.]